MRKILKLRLNTYSKFATDFNIFQIKKKKKIQISQILENPSVQNTIHFLLFSKVKSSTNTENLSEIHDFQENIQ